MENFFKTVGIWDIVEKGFMEHVRATKLLVDAIKELERNTQLDCKAFHYLNTQV